MKRTVSTLRLIKVQRQRGLRKTLEGSLTKATTPHLFCQSGPKTNTVTKKINIRIRIEFFFTVKLIFYD